MITSLKALKSLQEKHYTTQNYSLCTNVLDNLISE